MPRVYGRKSLIAKLYFDPSDEGSGPTRSPARLGHRRELAPGMEIRSNLLSVYNSRQQEILMHRSTLIAICLLALTARAQTLSISEASKHIGERATVCGQIAEKHTAENSSGKPTFVGPRPRVSESDLYDCRLGEGQGRCWRLPLIGKRLRHRPNRRLQGHSANCLARRQELVGGSKASRAINQSRDGYLLNDRAVEATASAQPPSSVSLCTASVRYPLGTATRKRRPSAAQSHPTPAVANPKG